MGTSSKKARKLRGHVSHGGGRVGKNRSTNGGHGKAGGQHHHRILFDKYHPGYFGKVGMRTFHYNKQANCVKSINLNSIWQLIPVAQRSAYLKAYNSASDKSSVPAPVVDITQFGFTKALGRGELPAPIILKARYVTRMAEVKVKKLGGACDFATSK